MNKDFRRRCKKVMAQTMRETKDRAKKDIQEAIHYGRVREGARNRYRREDNYNKKTCLWVGNDFVMPAPCLADDLGKPDNRIHRIHRMPPGPERKNLRSATPMGFAQAVFEANGGA